MASIPTDAGAAPDPLSLDAARSVPGVLGTIVRERVADYADAPPERPVDGRDGTGSGLRSPEGPGAFESALRAPGVRVIAEIKRSSPSQGPIAGPIHDLGPVGAARAYARAGAAAISVLTETRHFGGELAHLGEVSRAVPVPTLRKDFVVHPAQIVEARDQGAGAVLLMVAVLGERTGDYLRFAHRAGLGALVEVHDEAELDLALAAGARVLGVNNRDLRSLEVDLGTAPRLIARARAAGFSGVAVAESGYRTPAEIGELRGVADGVLVGTSVAASDDLERAVAALVGAGRIGDAGASTAEAPATEEDT